MNGAPYARRVARCEECGESREMATKSECFTCYRRREREAEGGIDRHNLAIRREHRRLLNAYNKLMGAASELHLVRGDVHRVLAIVRPYLASVAEYLAGAGEHEHPPTFTGDDSLTTDLKGQEAES